MNDVFKITPMGRGFYRVNYKNNGAGIGTFEREIDGYFNYYMPPMPTQGFIPSFHLKLLADMLDEINEPWDKIVEQGLAKTHQSIKDAYFS